MPDFLESRLHARPCVCAESGTLALYFRKGELQSLMAVEQPSALALPYTKTMMGFLLTNPNPLHILMIGLGGGSIAKFCYHHLPNVRITVVEINPHVIAMRSLFQIPEDDARFKVVCADGADYVQDAPQIFDVMLIDGFDVQGQSDQLSKSNFYKNCSRALMPSGVMVVNLDGDHPYHPVFLQRIGKAYKKIVLEVPVVERGNHIVFAAKDAVFAPKESHFVRALEQLTAEAKKQLRPEFRRILLAVDQRDAPVISSSTDRSGNTSDEESERRLDYQSNALQSQAVGNGEISFF